jgi:hypothetical protein
MANFLLSRHCLTGESGAEFGWSVAVRPSRLQATKTAATSTSLAEFMEGEEVRWKVQLQQLSRCFARYR